MFTIATCTKPFCISSRPVPFPYALAHIVARLRSEVYATRHAPRLCFYSVVNVQVLSATAPAEHLPRNGLLSQPLYTYILQHFTGKGKRFTLLFEKFLNKFIDNNNRKNRFYFSPSTRSKDCIIMYKCL